MRHCDNIDQGRGGQAAGEQGPGHGGEDVIRGVHGGADQGREAVQADGQGRGRIRHKECKSSVAY